MSKPVAFLKETYTELKQVIWPTRQQVIRLTLIVITISLVTGFYIGALDFAFAKLMETILR